MPNLVLRDPTTGSAIYAPGTYSSSSPISQPATPTNSYSQPVYTAPKVTAPAPVVPNSPISSLFPAGSTTSTTTPSSTPTTSTTGAAPATYGTGYYKDPTSGAYFSKDANGQVAIVTSAAVETQLKGGQLAFTAAPYTQVASSGTPIPPSSVTTIGSTVGTPSGSTATPAATVGNAPTLADQFNTSLATTIATQQKQLQDELAAKTASYQTQIDDLKTQSDQYRQLQESGLANENSTIAAETAAKQAALDQEQQQFQQNYQARQKLTDQLTTLLTTGQQVIEQMKGTTGLSSIMNPRISQTMTDVQAQAGVITAALSAYSDQIGLAQSQLSSATAAITSIYKDQIDYWNNVVSFYNDQQKQTNTQVATLTTQQKTYVDAQLQILQDKVNATQTTAAAITKAMLDPATAMAYAKAGVTLTDSPEQISQKLSTYEAAQQKVWGAPTLVGGDYIQTNSLTGETRTVVANVAGAGGAGGTVTERQAAQLQAYSSAFVPGATLKDGTAIIDANGYVTPAAWKQAIADYGGARDDFIKKYGYLLYTSPKDSTVSASYGLTTQEQKLITG